MSDLITVDAKVKEGDDWRGTTDVSFGETETIEDEDDDGNLIERERTISYELAIRQLYDDEFTQAVDRIGQDNFEGKMESLDGATQQLSQSELETYRELSSKDPESMTEDDREQIQSLTDKVGEEDNSGIFDLMDPRMVDGLQYAAKKGVVPDEDDIDEVMDMSVPEQQERFGDVIQSEEKARKELQKMVDTMVEKSTGFTAYMVGLDVIRATMSGGSESEGKN